MTYLSLDELKAVAEPTGFNKEDYYETHSEPKFEQLLQRIEEETRAIINNQLMGEGYEQETGRVDTLRAPDKPHLQLVFPVNDVSKVEITTIPDGTWEELETDLYSFDDQGLRLRKQLLLNENRYWNVLNPLRRESNRATWGQIGDRVRVTYDRGYDTGNVPVTIKEVQRELVRRKLTHLRQDQNLSNLSPDNVPEFNQRELLTEDLQKRLDKITQTKNKYVMMR